MRSHRMRGRAGTSHRGREAVARAAHGLHHVDPEAPGVAPRFEERADAPARPSHRVRELRLDPAAVAALVPAVIEKFGRAPDLLVNNAALFAEGAWQDLSAAALAEMMQVNLSAPVMLAKTLVAVSEGQRPAIVNIVDQRVAHPVPDQIAYRLSKSALWQATATLAVAFGNCARVNAVAPGLTLATEDYSAAQVERLAKRMPLRALPTPAQIADAVVYLARAEAVTGQTIFVDGGAHLTPMGRDFVALERD